MIPVVISQFLKSPFTKDAIARFGACEAIGYPVRKLKRTQVAFLSLQGVKKGAYRELTDDEVVHLKKLVMHHE